MNVVMIITNQSYTIYKTKIQITVAMVTSSVTIMVTAPINT